MQNDATNFLCWAFSDLNYLPKWFFIISNLHITFCLISSNICKHFSSQGHIHNLANVSLLHVISAAGLIACTFLIVFPLNHLDALRYETETRHFLHRANIKNIVLRLLYVCKIHFKQEIDGIFNLNLLKIFEFSNNISLKNNKGNHFA